MKREEFKELVSLYRPGISWMRNGELDENGLDGLFEEFKEEVGNASPLEYAIHQYWGWKTHWKYDIPVEEFLESLKEEHGTPYETTEETVRFQNGTSRFRAETFVSNARSGGFTFTEGIIGYENYSPEEKFLGLQVSLPNETRGGLDRLHFYAGRQAEWCGDEPVVITGLIPVKYLFHEHNAVTGQITPGEFAISIRNYDKIMKPEILSVEAYGEKYGIK